MEKALVDLRKHLKAAIRAVDELKGTKEFQLTIYQISESLGRAWDWVEEYTDSQDVSENAGGPTHWQEQRKWDG